MQAAAARQLMGPVDDQRFQQSAGAWPHEPVQQHVAFHSTHKECAPGSQPSKKHETRGPPKVHLSQCPACSCCVGVQQAGRPPSGLGFCCPAAQVWPVRTAVHRFTILEECCTAVPALLRLSMVHACSMQNCVEAKTRLARIGKGVALSMQSSSQRVPCGNSPIHK